MPQGTGASQPQKVVKIKLTEEQKRELLQFVKDKGGDAGMTIDIVYDVDVKSGTVAPSTFLVGDAV